MEWSGGMQEWYQSQTPVLLWDTPLQHTTIPRARVLGMAEGLTFIVCLHIPGIVVKYIDCHLMFTICCFHR